MSIEFNKYFFFLQRVGSKYYLIAGAVFFLFYVVLKNKILHQKIQMSIQIKDHVLITVENQKKKESS
jgi:hypothetical protein